MNSDDGLIRVCSQFNEGCKILQNFCPLKKVFFKTLDNTLAEASFGDVFITPIVKGSQNVL